MTKKIIILGTGGNCIDILDTINDINAISRKPKYQCIGFLDDNENNWGREFYGVKVLGALGSASSYGECSFVNGIGSPFNFWRKKEIISKTQISYDRFETIIHPSASVSSMAYLSDGTVVLQHVTITSNVRIGNHVIILPNSVISHDDVIGDYYLYLAVSAYLAVCPSVIRAILALILQLSGISRLATTAWSEWAVLFLTVLCPRPKSLIAIEPVWAE